MGFVHVFKLGNFTSLVRLYVRFPAIVVPMQKSVWSSNMNKIFGYTFTTVLFSSSVCVYMCHTDSTYLFFHADD